MLKIKKQISTDEELARLQEDTAKAIDQERIPGQNQYEKHVEQQGLVLDSNEMIRRVLRMNHALWPEDSINCPGHANFYYVTPEGMKACAGSPFKKGPLREFSIVLHDTAGRPIGIEYGWREVLHRLLKQKLISWPQVYRYFPLHPSRLSRAFDSQTQKYKN
jgi:hypothetical protein